MNKSRGVEPAGGGREGGLAVAASRGLRVGSGPGSRDAERLAGQEARPEKGSPAVLPGWPSMLAKRTSVLTAGYSSIQVDIECSCPVSCSSSRKVCAGKGRLEGE